jgi:DNA processing protein
MIKEAPYWISLAHLPRWGYQKLNNLIIKFYHENELSIEEFFNLSAEVWRNEYGLSEKEIDDLMVAKSELPNNAFLAETLYAEGYELIPITSENYPLTLKENLKTSHAPSLLYVKGNLQILKEKSVAIVGSRNASEVSLQFTDQIAQIASKEYKVVVSGFAKGVDKQALDSAIKYKGQSIIVLPQGIMTFGSGYKTYYRQIVDGDLLVVSIFHPKAPWMAELAMARNPIIYGLANEIFVAESSEKGGTWSGVIDGLRRKRIIYVRQPEHSENNANNLLIAKGAIPVENTGKILPVMENDLSALHSFELKEPDPEYKMKMMELLATGDYSLKEIIERLKLKSHEEQLRQYLGALVEIGTTGKKPLKYTLKSRIPIQGNLFG